MTDKKVFTVIRKSGRTWVFDEKGLGNTYSYWDVLSALYDEHRTAGSNYDRPNMLLVNGTLVVSEGLSDLAWNYRTDLDRAYENARGRVRECHRRAFMEDL